jgi:hypothetical protein
MQRSILFAIDVEPDGRAEVRNDEWSGTAVTLRELAELRSHLEDMSRAPVRFNWFIRFDPQIEQTWGRGDWVQKACPRLIQWVQEKLDFTGIHPHFWRWNTHRRRWFNDFADSSWTAQCLRTSIAGYHSVFGARPLACRFGDHWMGNEQLKLLQSEGIRYDLSVEPGVVGQPPLGDPHATAWLPDYRKAPRAPYRPSATDFLTPETQPDARGSNPALWVVPVTTTQPPRWIPVRRFPFVVKASRPLNLVLHPRTTWQQLAAEIDRPCHEPLVFVLRSGDLAKRSFFANFKFVTERLGSYRGLRNCRFTDVEEAVTSFLQASNRRV